MNGMEDTVKELIEAKAVFVGEQVRMTAIEYGQKEILQYIKEKLIEKENWEKRRTLLKAWKSDTPLSKLNEFLFARIAMFA